MELGIFSRTYEYSDPEKSFSAMASHGLFRTQLNLSNGGMQTLPREIDEEKLGALEKALQRHGIVCDALSGTFNMIDPDEAAREEGIVQFETQCRIASLLNIPIVTLCTGSKNTKSKWLWHDDNLKESSWTELMHCTERLLGFADRFGVTLGVETECSNIVNTARRARLYLDSFKSPRLKIIMDGANLLNGENVSRQREVMDEAFELLGKDIVLAHAKDMRPAEGKELEFVAVGKGSLDFEYYMGLLRAAGYGGSLIMHGLSEAEVPESRRFLEGLI